MVLLNKVYFFQPDAWRDFTKHGSECVILYKCIGKFHKMAQEERPNAHRSTTDRFERICIEEGKIIFDFQSLHPFRVAMRERRTKADCVIFLKIMVDLDCATVKFFFRTE